MLIPLLLNNLLTVSSASGGRRPEVPKQAAKPKRIGYALSRQKYLEAQEIKAKHDEPLPVAITELAEVLTLPVNPFIAQLDRDKAIAEALAGIDDKPPALTIIESPAVAAFDELEDGRLAKQRRNNALAIIILLAAA